MYLDLLRFFILLLNIDNRWFSECIIFTQIYYSNQNQRAKALVVCMCSNSLAPCWDLPMTKMVAMQGFFIGCHIIIICSYIFLITSLQLNKMLCSTSIDVHSLSPVIQFSSHFIQKALLLLACKVNDGVCSLLTMNQHLSSIYLVFEVW